MNCERFNELSDLYLVGELRDQEREAIERHLEGCLECRTQVELDRAIRDSTRRTAAVGVTSALADRIRESLPAPQKLPARRWRRALLAAAAVLLIAATGVWYWGTPYPLWSPAEDMVHAHAYYIEQGDGPEVISADRAALTRWASDRLGYHVEFPAQTDLLDVRGVRVSRVNQYGAMLAFLDAGGLPISLFVFPAEEDWLTERDLTRDLTWDKGEKWWIGSVASKKDGQEYHVRIWRKDDLYYGIVTSDPGQLARNR